MYQGSASYLWENYDAVFLDALIDQTVELEKSINDEADISDNTVTTNNSVSSDGGFSLKNLEDCPCSEEDYMKFLQIQSMLDQHNNEINKSRKAKLSAATTS